MRPSDLLAIVAAGAVGSAVATLLVGASLVLVVPAVLGVTAVSLVADRTRRTSR